MTAKSQTDRIWDSSGRIDSTGSANAYVIEIAEPLAAYHRGMAPIRFKANFTNSGSATANIATPNAPSGLGAVTMKKFGGGADLASGDIVSGGIYTLANDGTNFQVLELHTGVLVTGNLADDSVTYAKLENAPSAGFIGATGAGDYSHRTPTQVTAALDVFTSLLKGLVPASGGGTVNFLRADGTFAAPSGITAGTAQATTSGTAFDFTGLPATVRRITVMFNGVSLSGSDDILVQIGDSGGVETTGYVSTGAQAVDGAVSDIVDSTAGFIINMGDAARHASGHMVLTLIDGSTWIASHEGRILTTRTICGGGVKSLSATLDRVRVTRTGTNTFDAGQVNILYE